jgi:hypothetical protein
MKDIRHFICVRKEKLDMEAYYILGLLSKISGTKKGRPLAALIILLRLNYFFTNL